MRFIRQMRYFRPANPNGLTIVYMMGYGGRMWQAMRHIRMLQRQGYRVLAMDFVDVLKRHDPHDLVDLMDQVAVVLEREALIAASTLLVGISLGGLVGYNLIRRYPQLNKLLVITGGDMTHIPTKRALQKHWRLSRAELAEYWKDVNIYTPPGQLIGKHVIMLLPTRDRMIDPDEVAAEIEAQSAYNDFMIVRTPGGHFRTIISQTMLAPWQLYGPITRLARFEP